MSDWDAVSRDDLLRWADSDGASSMLPALFRRLVYETGRDVRACDVAAGSGVNLGGFDGFVRQEEATPFIPAGASGWELSVDKKAPAKAEQDYGKRDRTPDGSPTTEAVYVQLIVRPWSKSGEFARTHTAVGTWREVRGYNVDRLASWIEQAPVTRLWFLERTGRSPVGARSADQWWERWSGATRPVLTPQVALARKSGVDELRSALRTPGISTICGPFGIDELLGCITAAATLSEPDVAARTVIVHDRPTWIRLLAWPSPLVLVAAEPALAAEVDPATMHTVLAPVPHSTDSDVVLDAVDTPALFEALQSIDPQARYEHATLARRSFVAFRRRLALRRELLRPGWGTAPVPRAIRAALMLTGWHDSNEADRNVLSALAGMPYELVREQLLAYAHGDDPLLTVTDQRWHLVSPLDAWQLLGPHLLSDDLTAFIGHAGHVLGERDPALDLPAADRWRASIEGRERRHSPALRRGVATGLALLGTTGTSTVATTGQPGGQWAGRAIRPLLTAANADRSGETWTALADLLPLLGEAAPREVLAALRAGVTDPDPVLATTFQDDPDTNSLFNSGSPHTSVLWALEVLAWNADLLSEATDVLASLAAIDPGGRLSNRPAASLARIFCAWHPDTAASPAARLVILDRLRTSHPAVAWQLLISLLPTGRGIHFPSIEPSFRDWKPEQQPLLRSDYMAMVDAAVDRLLTDVGSDAGRWKELLDSYGHLPESVRAKVRDTAAAMSLDGLDASSRTTICEAVRKLVTHHREYADSTWALPQDELTALETAFAELRSDRPIDRHRWLFVDGWPELGDLRRRDDFDAYDLELAARRVTAIIEITEVGGIEEAVRFAERVQAGLVGEALATAFADTHLEPMLGWLGHGDVPRRSVAHAYVWKLVQAGGLDWAQSILDRRGDLDPDGQARLLLYVDDVTGGAAEAARRGPDVEHAYWQHFNYLGRGSDFEHVIAVAGQLCRVGRAAAAMDMLAMYTRHHASTPEYAEAVAVALETFTSGEQNDPETRALAHWDFERLFACLDAHEQTLGRGRVTRLQWYFLPALGFDPPTTALHRQMTDDPSFFVEILSLSFRKTGDPPRTLAEPDRRAAENALLLLESWTVPPGVDAAGVFDVDRCSAWIEQGLALLDQAGRSAIGRQYIGHVLTYTPAGDQGWPAPEIADLIERLADDNIDKGIEIHTHNRRDVTVRGLTDGGAQEWALVTEHRAAAQRMRDSHPRVARIHYSIADSYAARARDEDADAELTRRGLDR